MEDIATAVTRVAAGLASGEIKQPIAAMILQNLVADHMRDQRGAAYVREKIAESLLKWNRGGSAV